MAKTPEQIREAKRLQKRKERAAKSAHLEAVGATSLTMTIYSGTRKELDELKQGHGFEDDGEIITLLIHNLSKCDMSLQEKLLAIPKPKTA